MGSGPGARAFPKDARLGLPTRAPFRRDYVVVPPHYLREPSGLASYRKAWGLAILIGPLVPFGAKGPDTLYCIDIFILIFNRP